MPSAVTTVSSIIWLSCSRETLIVVRPFIATDAVLYPRHCISTVFAAAVMSAEYFPSASVVVPVRVVPVSPLIMTTAPMTGVLSAGSVTFPFIVLVWARPAVTEHINAASIGIILFIILSFLEFYVWLYQYSSGASV